MKSNVKEETEEKKEVVRKDEGEALHRVTDKTSDELGTTTGGKKNKKNVLKW